MSPRTTDRILGGRYRLEEPIARGGMGAVWRGRDETLGRPVAVKLLHEGLADDARFIERFRREAQAAAGLTHPNIAGVYDYGEEASSPYIVMELVDGETLADLLARDGELDPEQAARIGAQIADALAEAHESGIVHRDVKSANVMITARGSVKVMDFGIASSAMSPHLTATGMVMGTARYLSPEQARGDRATPASDVYALGILLYEMLAGRPPFDRETPVATAMAHLNDEAPPLRAARPEVPQRLAAIVDACLAKDPAGRPSPTSALAEALRGGPVTSEAAAVVASEPASGAPTEALPVDPTTELHTEPSAGLATAPPPPPHRAARHRSTWTWLVAATALVGAVAAALLLFRLISGPTASEQVRVRNFVGLSRAAALSEAERLDLRAIFSKEKSTRPEGTVIRQTPQPGTRIESGGPVILTVSDGPPLVEVPSIDGIESEAEFRGRLEALGLAYGGIEYVKGERGILGTDPPVGSQVPIGTEVTLLIGEKDRGGGNGGGNGGDGNDD